MLVLNPLWIVRTALLCDLAYRIASALPDGLGSLAEVDLVTLVLSLLILLVLVSIPSYLAN